MEALPSNKPTEVLDLGAYMNAPTIQVNKPDFDAEIEDNTNPDDFEAEDDPALNEEPEVEKTYKDYIDDAGMFINLFDSFQTGILTPAYRAKIQEPDDSELISRYKAERKLIDSGQLKAEDAIDTDVFLDAVQRAADLKAALKTLPFSAVEKKRLTEPLAKVIHKYQGLTVSPEMALLLAVLMVMAPRIIQVLPDSWGDKFSSIATLGLLKNAKTE